MHTGFVGLLADFLQGSLAIHFGAVETEAAQGLGGQQLYPVCAPHLMALRIGQGGLVALEQVQVHQLLGYGLAVAADAVPQQAHVLLQSQRRALCSSGCGYQTI